MELTGKELAAQLLRLSGTDVGRCIQCGRCSATCPMGDKMDLLPSRMVWELINGNGEEMLAARSPWVCLSCMACSERCPRGVDPARLMEAVRQGAVRPRGETHLSPDDVPALLQEDMPQQALAAAFRKYRK